MASFSVLSRRLLLKASQAHTKVPQNVFPGTECCRHSECTEEYPLKYGREMMNVLAGRIHLFIVPFSLLWLLPLWFSVLRAQKSLWSFAAPRWLAYWLEPEGKRKKQKTPRVNRLRDRISLHMRGSTAMPAEGMI